MYHNPFSFIRKARVFTSFMVAILTNTMVFAEPVSHAFYNLSKTSNFERKEYVNTAVFEEVPKPSESFTNIEEPEEKLETSNYFAIYSAQEKLGEIGVKSLIDADYVHDNYFTLSIPNLELYQDSYAVLSYAVYGVDAKGATKSINNSAAYGGEEFQEESGWKQVKEYIPLAFLQSGKNEIFFNRSNESMYAYQVKNVQIHFQKELDAALQESKENFETTWQAMHSRELKLSLSTPSSFSEFSITTEEDDLTGWVYGLDFKDLKPLPREVHNVTQGAYLGYRWQGAVSEAIIEMPYNKSAIPAGYSAKDVKIYYFDAATRHWSPLPEIDHDYSTGTITAQMLVNDSGETDYINGVITQPEHPEVAAFTPTQISDMEYANPAEGVVSIAPPTANSRGIASTSFPIKLPAGRNGMQPNLSVDYNSEAGNGWLGKGWDLSFSSISVDTKWGVPEYHSTKETEVYTLDGQELVLKNGSEYTNAHREEGMLRATNRIFYLRKEGAYLKITRHGSNPTNYWWSVTDTQGYTSYYGGVTALQRNSVLSKTLNGGAIAQWALVRTEDPYGNYIDYTHTKRNFTVSPGVTAQEFYPNKITYTRHSAASNYYEVAFIRDSRTAPQNQSYSLRKDITTNGRFGFLTVTSSLLGEIQIQYVKGSTRQAIRYYTLDYKEDRFGHNLLTKISEYDSEKKLFYSNTLEYYDEIGSGSTIESDSKVWDIEEKALRTPLHTMANPALRGFLSSGSSLGASESTGFSVAGRVGVGIGKIPKNINNTVGFGMNYAQNTQETRISFIDINGDGLPDKIYSSSSGVYYRPNTGNGFGNLQPISGINSLSKTKTRSNSKFADANAFGRISIGYSDNKSKSTTDYYFTDFNGDGLPDLVANYGVRFNVTKNSGDYTMREFVSNDSDNTANPIEPGEISSDILEDIHFETLEELRALFPQYDHVKMWTAPYNGTVSVTGTAKLLALNSCEYTNTFKLSLEKFTPTSSSEMASLLHSTTLSTSGQQYSFSQTGITVQKGEVLFFRTHNQEYGCGGEVEWNPKVTYTTIPNIPNTTDENGQHLRQYDAAQDFIITNGGEWQVPTNYTSMSFDLDLESGRFNGIAITDDIDFHIEKISTHKDTGDDLVVRRWRRTYNANSQAFTGDSNDFNENLSSIGDYTYSYRFYAESTSNIAWHHLKWQPTISLRTGEYEIAPVSYNNYDRALTQSIHGMNSSSLPTVSTIVAGTEDEELVKVSHNLIDMPTSLSSSAMNSRLQEVSDLGGLPLPVHWVVKGKLDDKMQVLYKRTLYLRPKPTVGFGFSLTPNSWTDPTDAERFFYLTRLEVQQLRQAGDVIYAGFYTESPEIGLFNQAEISFTLVESPPPSTPTVLGEIATPFFVSQSNFSGMTYRGWSTFLYQSGLLLEEDDGEVVLDAQGLPIVIEDYGALTIRIRPINYI